MEALDPILLQQFSKRLLDWHHHHNDRTLPWKGVTDPYKIWLSEIMLQQTRAAQALPYYEKFIDTFPTVRHLAAADDEMVLKLWQGLGYYSRCRNLIKAARIISIEYDGRFPADYYTVLSLPGVGSYTAAAIVSFAYNLPYPVVDGNVYRVLARVCGIYAPIDITTTQKLIKGIATQLIDTDHASDYNQAIMDLGATVCTPANPTCTFCPMHGICKAYADGMTLETPIKSKKITVTERHFHYFIVSDNENSIYMRRRIDNDVWQDLYEPLLLETNSAVLPKDRVVQSLGDTITIKKIETARQRLTHQLIHTHWYECTIIGNKNRFNNQGRYYSIDEIKKLPLTKSVLSFFTKNHYF